MKIYFILTAIIAASQAVEWNEFKATYNKTYKNVVEESFRFNIYQENLKKINEHNERYRKGLETYKKGVNKFTDLRHEEFNNFRKSYTVRPKVISTENYIRPVNEDLPDSFDWRKEGAVTGIYDQEACHASWAFSAAAALEGAYKIKTGNLVSLSPQNLIDCSQNYGSKGCSYGSPDEGYSYIMRYGIMTEEDYPLGLNNGNCRFNSSQSVTNIKGYKWIKKDDEEEIKSAVANIEPISVTIVSTMELQDYKGGIFSYKYCNNFKPDHSTLIIGYGSEDGVDYWILKNSWGSDWGENGFFRLKRNSNMCGVASEALFPYL